jgi:threonine/homoserine/homoserine lactone efflux protein
MALGELNYDILLLGGVAILNLFVIFLCTILTIFLFFCIISILVVLRHFVEKVRHFHRSLNWLFLLFMIGFAATK